MEIEKQRKTLIRIFKDEFKDIVRYRSLIIQSNNLNQYNYIKEAFISACNALNIQSSILMNTMMFDDLGRVKACNEVIEQIEQEKLFILVEGPLHFLDKWTESQQCSFWNHYAYYTQKPYIVFCDTTRDINSSFEINGKYSNSSLIFIKSRQSNSRI